MPMRGARGASASALAGALLAALLLCASPALRPALAALPTVSSVEPRGGSLLGGTRLTIRGTNLWPASLAADNDAPLSERVVVRLGSPMGNTCDVIHYLSNPTKLVCVTRPVLDETAAAEMLFYADAAGPYTGRGCQARESFVYVYIDGQGGSVQTRNGAPRWNTGSCGAGNNRCLFEQSSRLTPRITHATKAASPGDVITVGGHMCFADVLSGQSSEVDEEGEAIAFEDEDAELALALRTFGVGVAESERLPALANVARVGLGGNFSCELRRPSPYGLGAFYQAVVTHPDHYFNGRTGVECNRQGCHCVQSAFQCRIPADLPAGHYPLSVNFGGGVDSALRGAGVSMPARFSVKPWGAGAPPASSHLTYTKASGTSAMQVVASATSITAVGARRLRVEGTLLGEVASITLAERHSGGGADCSVVSRASDGTWLECEVSGDDDIDALAAGRATDGASPELWAGVNGTGSGIQGFAFAEVFPEDPYVGASGFQRELWGFPVGTRYNDFQPGFWEQYADAKLDALGKIWAMRRAGRQPAVSGAVVSHRGDGTLQHGDVFPDLPDGYGRSVLGYYSGFFEAPESALFRFGVDYKSRERIKHFEQNAHAANRYRVAMRVDGTRTAQVDPKKSDWFAMDAGSRHALEVFTTLQSTQSSRSWMEFQGAFAMGVETAWPLKDAPKASGIVKATKHRLVARSSQSGGGDLSNMWSIDLNSATGGSFTLSLGAGRTTPPLAWDADSTTIDAAVRGLMAWRNCSRTPGEALADGFESELGTWQGGGRLDYSTAFCGRGSMRISPSDAAPGTGIFNGWDFHSVRYRFKRLDNEARYLSFAYLIPAGTKVNLVITTKKDGRQVGIPGDRCSIPMTWTQPDFPSTAWDIPPCGPTGVTFIDDGQWHVAEIDLQATMVNSDWHTSSDAIQAGIKSLSFMSPTFPLFREEWCSSAMEESAPGAQYRYLSGEDFFIDEIHLHSAPVSLTGVALGGSVASLTEGAAAAPVVTATRTFNQVGVSIRRAGGCIDGAGPLDGISGGLVLTADYSGLTLSGDAPDQPTKLSSDDPQFGDVTLTMTGASFPGGASVATVNPSAGPAAWEAAINGLLAGLDVTVREVGTGSVEGCGTRTLEIDWGVAAVLDDVVLADLLLVVAAGSTTVELELVQQGGVSHLPLPGFDRHFSLRSATPHVQLRTAAGAKVACRAGVANCTTDLSEVAAAGGGRRRLTATASRSAVLGGAADLQEPEPERARAPNAVEKRQAMRSPPHAGHWDDTTPPARVLSEEEIGALPARTPGVPGSMAFSSAKPAALEGAAARRRLLAMSPGDQLEHRWSDVATWGGDSVPSSADTDIVYIPANTTLVLDTDVYIRFWVVEGTLKIADDAGDLRLESQAVIVNGAFGKFQVGSEAAAHPHNFELLLHGTRGTLTLPKFGIKTLAMTDGELYMRGKESSPTWSLLESTAQANASVIRIQGAANWQVGDAIAIAGTGWGSEFACTLARVDDDCESEEKTITSVTAGAGYTDIGLDSPLKYTHFGYTHTSHGKSVDIRAEVLHLTRNVRIKGTENDPFFGSHVMVLRGKVNLLYVETTFAGQAYALGRYPFHIHTVGQPYETHGSDQSESNIEGCAIHKTFNRAITAHACHNLNIKRNVAYNSMGHQYFVEDGIETGNTYTENVGLIAHRAFSLLNTDQTPAVFWITNPNNNFIRNRAVGGHSFGFWFDAPTHPTGPSADASVYCRNQPLGVFDGNVAHSNGDSGFWLSEVDPTNTATPVDWRYGSADVHRISGVMSNCVAWGNHASGAATVGGTGHLQFVNWTFAAQPVGIDYLNVKSDRWWSEANTNAAVLMNPVFIDSAPGPLAQGGGCKKSIDVDTLRKTHGSGRCGIGGPDGGNVFVKDPTFVDFKESSAISISDRGFQTRVVGATFLGEEAGTMRVTFDVSAGQSGTILDMDGSVAGTGTRGYLHALVPGLVSEMDEEEAEAAAAFGAPAQTRVLGHLPGGDICAPSALVGGAVCDASKVTIGHLQVRRKSWGLASADFYVFTEFGFSKARFYMYDTMGRRYNNHMTVVLMPSDQPPVEHEIRHYLPTGWDPALKSWSAGELRGNIANRWAVLTTRSTDLPDHYNTKWGPEYSAATTNNFTRLGRNEVSFDAGWSGFDFVTNGARDWAYVPNVSNPENLGFEGTFKMLLSSKSYRGTDIPRGFTRLTCLKSDGEPTENCRLSNAKNVALPSECGPGGEVCIKQRPSRPTTRNECMYLCTRRWSCVGIEYGVSRKDCFLITSFPGGKTHNNSYALAQTGRWQYELYAWYTGPEDTWPPADWFEDPDTPGLTPIMAARGLPPRYLSTDYPANSEVADGFQVDHHNVCEMDLNACAHGNTQLYMYSKRDCPRGEYCSDVSPNCMGSEDYFQGASFSQQRPLAAAEPRHRGAALREQRCRARRELRVLAPSALTRPERALNRGTREPPHARNEQRTSPWPTPPPRFLGVTSIPWTRTATPWGGRVRLPWTPTSSSRAAGR